jgi:spoIIIJ-associated protein
MAILLWKPCGPVAVLPVDDGGLAGQQWIVTDSWRTPTALPPRPRATLSWETAMKTDQVRKEAESLPAPCPASSRDVSPEIEPEGDDGLYVNLVGNLFALPEERPVLAALEHLLRGALHRKTGADVDVILDANGAVKRRRAELIGFALSKAEEVVRERKRVRLNAMPAHERRMIHVTQADYPGVKTYSVGAGDHRRVESRLPVSGLDVGLEPDTNPEPNEE